MDGQHQHRTSSIGYYGGNSVAYNGGSSMHNRGSPQRVADINYNNGSHVPPTTSHVYQLPVNNHISGGRRDHVTRINMSPPVQRVGSTLILSPYEQSALDNVRYVTSSSGRRSVVSSYVVSPKRSYHHVGM